MSDLALSICINTKNRANFLAETLDSIIDQILPGVEIIVVDGASTDDTPAVMQKYSSQNLYIKYFRSDKATGIDDGYDSAVKYASGTYCWLMPDDDLIEPGALQVVLSKIQDAHDLIILNLNCFSKDLSLNLNQKLFPFDEDNVYSRNTIAQFLSDLGYGLSYIGCVVIKRDLWFENNRTGYFGTYFVHVGVICSSSKINDILFLHNPLIKHRSGNSSWTLRSFEIWYLKWPKLIWSFNQFSDEVKNKVVSFYPWKRYLSLLKSRAVGEFNFKIYISYLFGKMTIWERLVSGLISVIPRSILSLLLIIYCSLFKSSGHYTLYNLMVASPSPLLSRQVIRFFGLKLPYSKV